MGALEKSVNVVPRWFLIALAAAFFGSLLLPPHEGPEDVYAGLMMAFLIVIASSTTLDPASLA